MSGASILSVNVGQPRTVNANGREVLTSIFKTPVTGRVAVEKFNVAGDRQADLRVHGGPYKAVYLYPSEHYAFWKKELCLDTLAPGAFGENLTTSGLLEESVRVGDRFRFGSAVLQVSQPRMPCFKLALRFGRADMVKLFWRSGLSGIYFSIVTAGDLAAGDSVERTESGPEDVSVADVVRLYKGEEWSGELADRAIRSPLYGGWKQEIQTRLTES